MARSKSDILRAVPWLYWEFVRNFTRAKDELRMSFAEIDFIGGLADGHASKMMVPDKPCGRQATWWSADVLAQVVFGESCRVFILPKNDPLVPVLDAALTGRALQALPVVPDHDGAVGSRSCATCAFGANCQPRQRSPRCDLCSGRAGLPLWERRAEHPGGVASMPQPANEDGAAGKVLTGVRGS